VGRRLLIVLFFVAIVIGSLYIGSHHGRNTGKHKVKVPGISLVRPERA
jgi:hypothetical protein